MIGIGRRRPCIRESARSDMLDLSRAVRVKPFQGAGYSSDLIFESIQEVSY